MPRSMGVVMVAGVLSLLLAACSPPDVTLGSGGSATQPAAPAVEPPPSDPPFLTGRIVSVTTTEPVTTDCVSESDLDADGSASSDDPPICNPDPESHGSIHVKGHTEMVATILKGTPLARRTAGGGVEPIEFADLSDGAAVSLWVDGPVMESYPLQGGASYVLLED